MEGIGNLQCPTVPSASRVLPSGAKPSREASVAALASPTKPSQAQPRGRARQGTGW